MKKITTEITEMISDVFDTDSIIKYSTLVILARRIERYLKREIVNVTKEIKKANLWGINQAYDIMYRLLTIRMPQAIKQTSLTVDNTIEQTISNSITRVIKRLKAILFTSLSGADLLDESQTAIKADNAKTLNLAKSVFYIENGNIIRGYAGELLRIGDFYLLKGVSEGQLIGIDQIKSEGINVIKSWFYTYLSRIKREKHLEADGQLADSKGYFTINGKKTLAPRMFGDVSEDANCKCEMRVYIV